VRQLESAKRPRTEVVESILRDQTENATEIAAFHKAWYRSRQTWGMTSFEGVPVLKNPLDLWIVQEIIWELRPTLIIETGTAFGGSALFYARCMDKNGPGAVISIDCDPSLTLPAHPKISFITGYSVEPDIVEAVTLVAETHPRVMVVLDSDHSKQNVLDELNAYARLVTPGHMLIVEDTNLNGRPVDQDWNNGPGPGPAVDEWLPQHPEFEHEPLAERFMLTMHPNGWLRRRTE
jgi:cephalosporin hydroxylase